MPIYEYEPVMKPCPMCADRFAVIQALDEEPLTECPQCGLPCRRVISQVSVKLKNSLSYQRAADRGFTTWKRTGAGQWEKVAGEGVDVISGDPSTAKEKPVIDLDEE